MENELQIAQEDTYGRVRETILTARNKVYVAVNAAMVEAYWNVGCEIHEAQGKTGNAEYGEKLITSLSRELSNEFGAGFTARNLRAMRQFYLAFPKWHTVCATLCWSHYRLLIRVSNEEARWFYLHECAECQWSVRQLERQIKTSYYERLLDTQAANIETPTSESRALAKKPATGSILKDPSILEFLDLSERHSYHERDLEQALIDNLQAFLLELGKGFTFVARQKHIEVGGEHYYIDLVFYNYLLSCFVVIELKTGKLTASDIGQLDFYVRYFDEHIRRAEDNPTIGMILCADKNETLVKYSVLADKETLLASRYLDYLPSENELRHLLERNALATGQNLALRGDEKAGLVK